MSQKMSQDQGMLAERRAALARVPWLSHLDEAALGEVAATAQPVAFAPGEVIHAELEAGDDVLVITSGSAAVTVGSGVEGEVRQVGQLGPGEVLGEQAVLSFELRSATVTATGPVSALRLDRPLLESLLQRFPSIAAQLLPRVAARLRDTEDVLEALLSPGGRAAVEALQDRPAAARLERGSFRRAYRELVVAHRNELPFVALTTFVLALLGVRASVWLLSRLSVPLFPVLRAAYLCGLLLLFCSAGLLLFRFRRTMQRLVAIGYGIGFALIFNELSVFLAFDVFWTDMTHRDASLVFDPVKLYTRSEGHYAVGIALGILLQVTYLRKFYRRVFFILGTRMRRLLPL